MYEKKIVEKFFLKRELIEWELQLLRKKRLTKHGLMRI